MIPTLSVLLGAAALAKAQGFTPLASKRFEYTALPYQADSDDGERGRQYGYNICNSTTEGPESLCQTAIINSIEDFCLWGPPEPESLIGDTEGEAVAWCTQPGHGSRVIPQGAITGVQFIQTPDYIQVTGRIRQDLINIQADDSGGEMDPHGADQRGNPLGGLLFTQAWGNGYQQAVEWHNFMGGGLFCLKACDPAGPSAADYCEHIFDRIGCWYNAPADYEDGVFESCQGESQDFPGIYTGSDGEVSTYTQPPESLGEIATMPYQPRIPATSQCTEYDSASIYAAAPTGSVPPESDDDDDTTTRNTRTTNTRSNTRTNTNTADSADETDTEGAAVNVRVGGGLAVALIAAVAGLVL